MSLAQVLAATLSIMFLLSASAVSAQDTSKNGVPATEHLAAANSICEEWFSLLKDGKTEEFADALTEEIGSAKSPADKMQIKADTKSRFDMILAGPPVSAFGRLDGYDLLLQSWLPGTDRFFRQVYMAYHTEGFMVWEFRWYVTPAGKVTLNNVSWNDGNPFEFLATSDKLFPDWYR